MSNCVQITIGGNKYKFNDIDVPSSMSLNDLIDEITKDPNSAELLYKINEDLNINEVADINDQNNTNTFIADNIVGNIDQYSLTNIYKRSGVPNSELLTAMFNISTIGKNTPVSYLVSDASTQIFLGNNRNLVVVNKNDLFNQSKILGIMSYLTANSQILDNKSATYKIIDNIYSDLMNNPTGLREEISKIPNKYQAYRRLLYYTQSDLYKDDPSIIKIKRNIAEHFLSKCKSFLDLHKNSTLVTKIKTNPLFFQALEELSIKQELPTTINLTDNNVIKTSDLTDFRLKYLNLGFDEGDSEEKFTDEELVNKFTSLNPNGTYNTDSFPTNLKLREFIYNSPIASFIFDVSNFNKISKYTGKGNYIRNNNFDINNYISDLIQESSINKIDFGNSALVDMFIPNVKINMDEDLTSKPARSLLFNHSESMQSFSGDSYKIIFNPNIQYINVVSSRTANTRIEINPNFNLNIDNEYVDKINAIAKAASKINSGKKIKSLSVRYQENYDYSLENGMTNLNNAMNAFNTAITALYDYINPDKRFFYVHSDGIGKFAQHIVANANELQLTPILFEKLSKGYIYDRLKEPNQKDWIDTFSSLMNAMDFSDQAVHRFFNYNSFTEKSFSSKRVNNKGEVVKNLNLELSKIEEERGQLDQFDMLQEGIINTIPINPSASNFALTRKIEGDVFKLKDYKTDRSIYVQLDKKITLGYKNIGARNLSEDKELFIGDIIKLNPEDNYQITIIGEDNGKYIGAYIPSQYYFNDPQTILISKEDLANVNLVQYTAKTKELDGDNYIYTNLGMYRITPNNTIQFSFINEDNFDKLLSYFFKEEIQDISRNSGFSEEFIEKNYINNRKFKNSIFLSLNLAQKETINEISTNNNDNLKTSEYLEDLASNLSKQGINIHSLREEEIKSQFPNLASVKAFISNGEIFLNLDNIDDNTLVHEISHLFLADLKSKNIDSYINLVDKMKNSESYYEIEANNMYNELTYNDKLEEALVHEFSDYFTGILKDYRDINNNLENLDWSIIFNDILNIDTKKIERGSIQEIMNTTLKKLHDNYSDQNKLFDKANAIKMTHISNIKSEMLKNLGNDGFGLTEICK